MNHPATRQLLVMRHAEKPDDPHDPNLSPAGYARAKRLASYLPETFGKPAVIVAAAVSPDSSRPLETVTPLAQQCGLTVQMPYADDQFVEAAQLLLTGEGYRDQPLVVCCWHHGKLPKLMHALGCAKAWYPDPWNPAVFDLILKVGIDGGAVTGVEPIREPF